MIAGYITARVTFLARVVMTESKPQLLNVQRYNNNDFSGFDSLLSLYLRKNKGATHSACFGVAGPVINNIVTATNIPWKIDGKEIKENYSFENVSIVNDLEATTEGLFSLDDDKFFTINKGHRVKNGNIAVIAAGTGLGEGFAVYDGRNYKPYPSEGGHVGFSPGSQLEIELWEYLYSINGYVECEDVISLTGLENIFQFLLDRNRLTKPDWFKKTNDKANELIEMALSGKDETAVSTMDLFVNCFATEAANLALKGITLGGIYLCGYIAPQVIPFLDKGQFMRRFVQKGKMENFLSKMPVSLIIEDKTALIGAGIKAAALNQS